jgi:hypothetical protein
MAEKGIDISGQRSKHLDEFVGEKLDYVVTVCGPSALRPTSWRTGFTNSWRSSSASAERGVSRHIRGARHRRRGVGHRLCGARYGFAAHGSGFAKPAGGCASPAVGRPNQLLAFPAQPACATKASGRLTES